MENYTYLFQLSDPVNHAIMFNDYNITLLIEQIRSCLFMIFLPETVDIC